jgi:hypothetical protein
MAYHYLQPHLEGHSDGVQLTATLAAGAAIAAVDYAIIRHVLPRSMRNAVRLARRPRTSRLRNWLKTVAGAAIAYCAIGNAAEAFTVVDQSVPSAVSGSIVAGTAESEKSLEQRVQSAHDDASSLAVPSESVPSQITSPSIDYWQVDYNNPVVQQNIANGIYEDGFLDAVEAMCQRLGMNAMAVLSVMDFETGGRFAPDARNPVGSATGLIQFTDQTVRSLGTTTTALARLSQIEQLAFVEEYFRRNRNGGDYAHPEDVALAVFYPAAVGKDPHYVIGRKAGSRFQRKVYRQNAELDMNRDGSITIDEYVTPALNRGYLTR